MFLEEKIEGRKVQFLPFLLSKNMRKYTLKNTGFCPNKVIHFKLVLMLSNKTILKIYYYIIKIIVKRGY